MIHLHGWAQLRFTYFSRLPDLKMDISSHTTRPFVQPRSLTAACFLFVRFAINLQVGPNVNPRDDIAMHVNVRFDENSIVRNSLMYQNWGDEERQPNFMPLQRGVNFEILILCEQAEYKVRVMRLMGSV